MLAPGPDGLPVVRGGRATGWRANVLVPAQLIVFLVGVVVVSLIGAVVWAYTAPMPTGIVIRPGTGSVPSEQLSRYFDGIGWFCLGLLVIGVVAGLAFWWVARSWRGPIGAIALLATTVVASGLAIEVAQSALRIRLPDPTTLPQGTTFAHGPKLWMAAPAEGAVGAPGILLILMPVMALLVYLFHVLLASDPALGADAAVPGELVVEGGSESV
ncbi:hypothetical protein nbrc107697_22730 [Gordonia crocea]|uniref:DUF2567 domain-containing protein n=2 Tax=Gordonia crocea TaxID=589162 RepID=A0A7I9UYF8_9ACTN|nr:hypothetical protein nbrc107697_22730 [Gordonia crocea]